jgi:AcrR family transcriptional regulator
MRGKPRYPPGKLRQALIAAAVDIIEKQGPDALTLREVAHRVGVSHAAPYHHFPDREAILAAVAEEGFGKLAEAMEDARAVAGRSPRARLCASGVGYVRFATHHPSHFRVMFAGIVPITSYPSLGQAGMRAFGILMEGVVAAQEAHLLREGPPAELALLAWSMVHGVAMLQVNGILAGACGKGASIDHLAQAATEAIVRGLQRLDERS